MTFTKNDTAGRAVGAYLNDADIREVAALMAELRDITRSRATFLATTLFLTRFGMAPENSSIVDPDAG